MYPMNEQQENTNTDPFAERQNPFSSPNTESGDEGGASDGGGTDDTRHVYVTEVDDQPLIDNEVGMMNSSDGRDFAAHPHCHLQYDPTSLDLSAEEEYDRSVDIHDGLQILQAVVFMEDSARYRSVEHKVDKQSLVLYRLYHSLPFSLLRYFFITVLHLLAFIEFPSSLTLTSDIRTRGERITLPCGVTESIELLCLLFLLVDVIMKVFIYGMSTVRNNKWLVVEILCLFVSFTDWSVSLVLGCHEVVRVRRMLRPVFIIQNSSLMKKILNSLRKTMSQILGVLLLMALHLYVFTLFGMLLFPKTVDPESNVNTWQSNDSGGNTTQAPSESKYFRTLTDAFMDLLVLLTTANNPDVTLPAYSVNRFYAIFFIVFLMIGLYCFMNMLTAIIYNQFRDYFKNSMQSSLNRRRLGQRAVYECLKKRNMSMHATSSITITRNNDSYGNKVAVRDLKGVIAKASLPKDMKVQLIRIIAESFSQKEVLTWSEFLEIMCVMEKDKDQAERPRIRWFMTPRLRTMQKIFSHKWFSYFGTLIGFINVVLVSVELATEYDKSLTSSKSALRIINFIFIIYYVLEQTLILICLGWRRYRYNKGNLFDLVIVILLVLGEVITIGMYGFPFFSNKEVHGDPTLWNIVRIINILIMARLLRVIWHIHAMAIVAHTLFDLVKNLQSFGGILVVIYYTFAILGMELFQDIIPKPVGNISAITYTCGTYEQLEYWANNFDDFAAAIVVLWDVMVVNNWFIFLDVYQRETHTKWSYMYFIIWWLTSVVLILNLFTALILENFIMKWDKFNQTQSRDQPRQRLESRSMSYNINTITVHDMFRPNLQEPSEESILAQLQGLDHFNRPL